MALYCLDCWNELNDAEYTEDDFYISKHLELCEGCAQYKKVIVGERDTTFLYMFTWQLEAFLEFLIAIARGVCKLYKNCQKRIKEKKKSKS